jgi:DNA-binding MarR family transcriptional regulator
MAQTVPTVTRTLISRSRELESDSEALEAFLSETLMFLHLAARRHGLTLSQLILLRMLEVKGPLPPSRIAAHFGISRPAVTSSLNILESQGWIVRTSPPGDRRSIRTSLTARSRALLKAVESERRQFLVDGLSRIPVRQRAGLGETVRLLVASLRNAPRPRGMLPPIPRSR